MTVHDLPDYTREVIIKYTGGFIGLEELAVRLGSIAPWDLKGNVVLMEDFATELTEWSDESSGGTCAATRTSRHKASGGWAVKLYNSGGSGNYACLTRKLYFPEVDKYALFALLGWDADCRMVELELYMYSGTNRYAINVRYDLPTEVLDILTTGDTYTNVATSLSLSNSDVVWYPLLLTFDLDTERYDKLYLAGVEYDISTIPLYVTGDSSDPVSLLSVIASLGNATPFTAYADCVILAKNVP